MRTVLGRARARRLSVAPAVVLLLASACAHTTRNRDAATPRALQTEAWRWTDDAGKAFSFAQLRGQRVVLSMFFRSCQFACPVTLARMQGLERAFEAHGLDAHFVLVTLDPGRDTPGRLASFRSQHGLSARWTLLVGSLEQTVELSRLLAVQRIQDDNHILHEVRIVVLSADQRRMRTFEGWNFDDATALGFR